MSDRIWTTHRDDDDIILTIEAGLPGMDGDSVAVVARWSWWPDRWSDDDTSYHLRLDRVDGAERVDVERWARERPAVLREMREMAAERSAGGDR